MSPLCDRNTDVDIAKSQVGFFKFICLPFYAAVADLVDPNMQPIKRLQDNLRFWQGKKASEKIERVRRVSRDNIQLRRMSGDNLGHK